VVVVAFAVVVATVAAAAVAVAVAVAGAAEVPAGEAAELAVVVVAGSKTPSYPLALCRPKEDFFGTSGERLRSPAFE